MAESGPQKASEPDPDASRHSETAEESPSPRSPRTRCAPTRTTRRTGRPRAAARRRPSSPRSRRAGARCARRGTATPSTRGRRPLVARRPSGPRRSSASARSCGLNSLPSRRSRATSTARIRVRRHIVALPYLTGERAVRVMGNIFAIAQLDMQYTPAPLLPSAVRDVLARRQKKLRLPNGSVVVMTPCAVDASAPPRGFRTRRTYARRSR